MKINATDFKNHLGEYMGKVHKEPIIIEKSGKPTGVFISYEEYERLSELEDFYWGMKAQEAAREGFIGQDESEKILEKLAKKAGIKSNDSEKNS